jgi:hypothetical protein
MNDPRLFAPEGPEPPLSVAVLQDSAGPEWLVRAGKSWTWSRFPYPQLHDGTPWAPCASRAFGVLVEFVPALACAR